MNATFATLLQVTLFSCRNHLVELFKSFPQIYLQDCQNRTVFRMLQPFKCGYPNTKHLRGQRSHFLNVVIKANVSGSYFFHAAILKCSMYFNYTGALNHTLLLYFLHGHIVVDRPRSQNFNFNNPANEPGNPLSKRQCFL